MLKFYLLYFCFGLVFTCGAKNEQELFIQTYAPLCMEEARLFNIPASIKMAQALLESSSGKSRMARVSNNFFGMKHKKSSARYTKGKRGYSEGDFAEYASPWWSFRHHSVLLSTSSRYNHIFPKYGKNYKAWAYQLRINGYAEDKNYPQKLIRLIERFKLYHLDGLSEPVKNPNARI